MAIVVLVRPGATAFELQDRIEGSLSLPMCESCVVVMEQLVEALPREATPRVVLCGPAESSRATAESLGGWLGVPVKASETLGNINLGLWQGLAEDDVRRKQPRLIKQFEENSISVCPSGGETITEFIDRVGETLERPLRKFDAIAIVMAEPGASLVRQMLLGQPYVLERLTNRLPPEERVEFINTETGAFGHCWDEIRREPVGAGRVAR